MGKPKHIKPGLYAIYFEQLKDIACEYGFNLVVHGSLNRDLDLIAIPWRDGLCHNDEQEMIAEFNDYLTGRVLRSSDKTMPFTILPGNRHSYVIELNRGDKHGEWVRFADEQYYLDISVVPPIRKVSIEPKDK